MAHNDIERRSRPAGPNVLLHWPLTEADKAIVSSLQEDGRRPFVNIARDIGVTEKTVRNRVRHLLDSRIIQIVAITSPAALGYHAGAMIGVTTDPGIAASEIAAVMTGIAEVDYVVVTAGRYSILVELLARDMRTLQRTIEQELGKIRGVVSLEVFPYFSIHYQQARFPAFDGELSSRPAVRSKEIDEIDKNIVAQLNINGRMPVIEIAEKLDISETQARKRIKRMIETESINVIAIINPMNLAFEAIAWVAIQAGPGQNLRQLADQIAHIGAVSYIAICAGRFDIFAEFVCASNDELLSVLDDAVRPLPGVARVESFLYINLHYKRLVPVHKKPDGA